jgi:hypothetical protein
MQARVGGNASIATAMTENRVYANDRSAGRGGVPYRIPSPCIEPPTPFGDIQDFVHSGQGIVKENLRVLASRLAKAGGRRRRERAKSPNFWSRGVFKQLDVGPVNKVVIRDVKLFHQTSRDGSSF